MPKSDNNLSTSFGNIYPTVHAVVTAGITREVLHIAITMKQYADPQWNVPVNFPELNDMGYRRIDYHQKVTPWKELIPAPQPEQ